VNPLRTKPRSGSPSKIIRAGETGSGCGHACSDLLRQSSPLKEAHYLKVWPLSGQALRRPLAPDQWCSANIPRILALVLIRYAI
jgi:hypothetical protein